MNIELDKSKQIASPHTGHKCFLGNSCDLWWRKDNVTVTCGLTNFQNINNYSYKYKELDWDI